MGQVFARLYDVGTVYCGAVVGRRTESAKPLNSSQN